jgi:hypothetical protein
MSKTVNLSCVLFLMLTMSAIAFGQSTTSGAIGGVVTNPNKEVVPGATVTVLNNGTNKEDTGTADDQGSFRIGNLQPGSYTVTIQWLGIQPLHSEQCGCRSGTCYRVERSPFDWTRVRNG